MRAEVSFRRDGHRYAVRFDYDPHLVLLVKQLASCARRWRAEDKSWRVATPRANRLAYEMDAHGCLITGLESEPARRNHQHDGDMYCSSRCRQRAYRRRSSTITAYGMGFADVARELR